MGVHRVAGIMLITGFITLIGGAILGPPGLYQTDDIGQRLQILENLQTRWIVERVGSVLFCLLYLAGFALLAYDLWSSTEDRIALLGGVAFLAATVSAMAFIYLQTSDPRSGYSGAYPFPEELAYWLWLAGMLFFGAAFVMGTLPDWLGILTAGVALIYSIVFLFSGIGAFAPFLLTLVGLVTGVVLLLR